MDPAPAVASVDPAPGEACRHHPGWPATTRCSGCGGTLCGNCVVEMLGHRLCAACKHRYVCELRRRGSNGAGEGQMTLMLALLGLIVCGPVISPLALMRGRALLREHRRDAAWAGRSTALAAVWISAVTLVLNAMMVLWVAGMAAWYGW